MYEDLQFQKKKGWYIPSQDFIHEWEAYGLTEDDYFHAREDYPDYWEYHWLWQEPERSDGKERKVFRKCYTDSTVAIRSRAIPLTHVLAQLEARFIHEINTYYFHV